MPKLGYGYALYPGSASSLPSDISGLGLWLKADAGVNTIQKSTLENKLLAYWKLDTDSWLDSSGNGNALTGINGVAVGTGLISGCAEILANGSYFYKSPNNFNVGSGNITASIWIKPSSYGSGGYDDFAGSVFDFREFDYGTEWLLIFTDYGKLRIFQNGIKYETTATISLNSWSNIVITRNSGTTSFYINGSLDGTFADTENFLSQVFIFGGPVDNPSDYEYLHYDGRIDEAAVWNRALTGAEITSLYNSGAGKTYPFEGTSITTNFVTSWTDQSGTSKNMFASAGNEPTFIASELNGKPVIDFATNKYLTASFNQINITEQTTFTIFKFSSNLTSYARVFSQSDGINPGYQTSGNILPLMRKDGTNDMWCYSEQDNWLVSSPTSLDSWYISTTRTGANGAFSLNSNSIQTFNSSINANISKMRVGAEIEALNELNALDYFNSKVAEVIVYTRSLTDTEIKQVQGYLNAKYAIY